MLSTIVVGIGLEEVCRAVWMKAVLVSVGEASCEEQYIGDF